MLGLGDKYCVFYCFFFLFFLLLELLKEFLKLTGGTKMKPYKPKIRIDTSGASCWENMNEYFFSDEGKEFLKGMNKFAKQNMRY